MGVTGKRKETNESRREIREKVKIQFVKMFNETLIMIAINVYN